MGFRNPILPPAGSELRFDPRMIRTTADQTLTAAAAVVPDWDGAVSAPADPDEGTLRVTAVCDFHHTAAGGGNAILELYANGVRHDSNAVLNEGSVRATVVQVWDVPVLANEAMTIQMKVLKDGAGGTVLLRLKNSTLTSYLTRLVD